MDTLNQDIIIRVRSEYQDLQNLQNKLEQLKSQFKSISKGRVDFGLKKMIRTSADPIKEASKQLEIAQKNLERTQTKLRTAMVTGADTTTIGALRNNESMAKSRLMSVIKTVEHTKEIAIEEERITAEYQKQQAYFEKLSHAQEALNKFMLSLDPVKQKMSNLQNKMSGLQQEFVNFNMEGKNTKGTENAIKKVYKQMQKLEESTKKTSNKLSVLWGRIKNIAVYRTIRRTLQIIFQTITKGFQRVTELNKDAENLALRLKANYNLIATAIGVTLYTVLKSFIGQVDDLTDTMLNYINAFNRGIAVVTGQDKYLKVVRKDIDAINKSVNNLSFDKFESLTKSNNSEETSGVGLIETLVGDNPTETEKNMLAFVETLQKAYEAIEPVLQRIKWVIGEILDIVYKILRTGIIQWIVGIIAHIVEFLDKAGLLKGALVGLLTLGIMAKIVQLTGKFKTLAFVVTEFVTIFTVVKSLLDKLPAQTRIYVGALTALVGGFVALFVAIQMLKKAWTGLGAIAFGVAAGAAAIAGIAGIVSGTKEINAAAYAEGGIPEKSELFYMNENGVPEALVNTGGSQTNVINIDQLSEGMRRGFVQAIYDTGLLNAIQQGSSTIVVDKDVLGRTVAESAGFRNEVNRRNVSLNLR